MAIWIPRENRRNWRGGEIMKRYYIAYGSNLSEKQMAYRCPTAKVVGTSILKDWRLLFDGPASIEECEGYEVPVLIWEIQPRDEMSLDRYEGYPSYYRKEMLDVEVNGEILNAMVYIMNTNGESKPSDMYYNVLKQGYERFGFNKRILEKALEESKEW